MVDLVIRAKYVFNGEEGLLRSFYRGQVVTVISRLSDSVYGPIYEVLFSDGRRADIFGDEVEPLKETVEVKTS